MKQRKNRLDLEHGMFCCSEQTSALSIPKLYRFFNGFFQIPVTPTEISIHGKAVLWPTRFGDFSSCLLSMTLFLKRGLRCFAFFLEINYMRPSAPIPRNIYQEM